MHARRGIPNVNWIRYQAGHVKINYVNEIEKSSSVCVFQALGGVHGIV